MDVKYDFLVDLDSLVDTRLSLLMKIDKDLTKELVKNGKYKDRVNNEFDYIPENIFNKLFKYRKKELLELPIHTEVVELLKEYVVNCETLIRQHNGSVKGVINTYPYLLSEEEKSLLEDSFSKELKTDIEIVYVEDIIISELSDRYGMLVLYDGLNWLENKVNDGSVLSSPIPEVTLITIKKYNKKEKDFNEKLEDQLKILIDLKLVDYSIFSLR